MAALDRRTGTTSVIHWEGWKQQQQHQQISQREQQQQLSQQKPDGKKSRDREDHQPMMMIDTACFIAILWIDRVMVMTSTDDY
jgi:hypothetical protein